MAGDWIKMRADLQTHPKVVRILSALRLQSDGKASDKFRVIGGLHAVWCVFDQHTEDGVLKGYTPETMDHVVGINGISQAMIDVGWMRFHQPETLIMVEFGEHNGQSAKRRAEDQKRKRKARRSSATYPQDDGQVTGQVADKKRTREEKRREEDKNNRSNADAPDRFADFWGVYPKKVKKAEAQKKWKARKLDRMADKIIDDVKTRQVKDRRWLDGFVPDPTTYINGQRWEDEIDTARKPSTSGSSDDDRARPESKVLN